MIQAATVTTPADSSANRPAEKSSRLSTGVVPVFVILLVVIAARMRRRRRAEAMHDVPPVTRE